MDTTGDTSGPIQISPSWWQTIHGRKLSPRVVALMSVGLMLSFSFIVLPSDILCAIYLPSFTAAIAIPLLFTLLFVVAVFVAFSLFVRLSKLSNENQMEPDYQSFYSLLVIVVFVMLATGIPLLMVLVPGEFRDSRALLHQAKSGDYAASPPVSSAVPKGAVYLNLTNAAFLAPHNYTTSSVPFMMSEARMLCSNDDDDDDDDDPTFKLVCEAPLIWRGNYTAGEAVSMIAGCIGPCAYNSTCDSLYHQASASNSELGCFFEWKKRAAGLELNSFTFAAKYLDFQNADEHRTTARALDVKVSDDAIFVQITTPQAAVAQANHTWKSKRNGIIIAMCVIGGITMFIVMIFLCCAACG